MLLSLRNLLCCQMLAGHYHNHNKLAVKCNRPFLLLLLLGPSSLQVGELSSSRTQEERADSWLTSVVIKNTSVPGEQTFGGFESEAEVSVEPLMSFWARTRLNKLNNEEEEISSFNSSSAVFSPSASSRFGRRLGPTGCRWAVRNCVDSPHVLTQHT